MWNYSSEGIHPPLLPPYPSLLSVPLQLRLTCLLPAEHPPAHAPGLSVAPLKHHHQHPHAQLRQSALEPRNQRPCMALAVDVLPRREKVNFSEVTAVHIERGGRDGTCSPGGGTGGTGG